MAVKINGVEVIDDSRNFTSSAGLGSINGSFHRDNYCRYDIIPAYDSFLYLEESHYYKCGPTRSTGPTGPTGPTGAKVPQVLLAPQDLLVLRVPQVLLALQG